MYNCFGTSCFIRCNNLFRFVSSNNLCRIGKNTFSKGSSNFRECFLATKKAKTSASGLNYPWGIVNERDVDAYGTTLFMSGSMANLVIYVDGEAPGLINQATTSGDPEWPIKWNTETIATAFANELQHSTNDNGKHAFTRSSIPTFYNIDWQNDQGVL